MLVPLLALSLFPYDFPKGRPAQTPAATQPDCTLEVQLVQQHSRLRPEELRLLQEQAERIWEAHGIRLLWPGMTHTGDARHGFVRAVLLDRYPARKLRPASHGTGIAFIDFLAPDLPARAIYLIVHHAERLLDRTGTASGPLSWRPAAMQRRFVAQTLGRALAHELGHFLLRSTAHSRHGLMRQDFPTTDLFDPRTTRFQLDARQNARLVQLASAAGFGARCVPEPVAAAEVVDRFGDGQLTPQ